MVQREQYPREKANVKAVETFMNDAVDIGSRAGTGETR
jgi:hypothetical protein